MDEQELPPASQYFGELIEVRERIRENWKKDAGDLLDAHAFAFSAVILIARRMAFRKFTTQTHSVEGRLALTALFVQGVELCETAIAEGLYSQSASLLKQEMETIEAIHEFESDRRKPKITPKIRMLREFGFLYGFFNEISHAAMHNINDRLTRFEIGDYTGPSIYP